ncbi:4Fe-4S dicluster domain-containing protein [Candidatus Saganbacteria bacterium]|nr:4Fe-4S dicluster domain-containing protein [Candidatus Saganbacteria bacterium]
MNLDKNLSRRDFLGLSLKSLILLLGLGFPKQLLALTNSSDYSIEEDLWGYGIDVDKCIGCGRCVNACKTENNVPDQPYFFRTWIERYVERHKAGEAENHNKIEVDSPNGGKNGFPDLKDKQGVVKSFFVPKICNHCEHPPCVQVCPVGATYKSKDGVVLVDPSYCIGCRYCIQACPYGARYLHPEKRIADKCTLCYHRITKGLKPACVQACPTGARLFGNLKNVDSPISKFIRAKKVQVLKPDLGTRPKIFYSGIDKEVR